jgi:hypothetical protein
MKDGRMSLIDKIIEKINVQKQAIKIGAIALVVGLILGGEFRNSQNGRSQSLNILGSNGRYQAFHITDMIVLRLDTKTGELKTFAPTYTVNGDSKFHYINIGHSFERYVSPSEVKIVTDMNMVEKCASLPRDFSINGSKEDAAQLGGDTIFQGELKTGSKAASLFRCNSN